MKYLHGVDLEPAYQEKTALDHAIDSYKKTAKQYHQALNDAENAPVDVREKRKTKVKQIENHLNCQAMSAMSMASVQAQLDEYREKGRDATRGKRSEIAQKQTQLAAEGHHKKDLQMLEAFMKAEAMPKPGPNHTAHHIVPGKGRTKDAYLARVRLHLFGIRINDPDNGVWLPQNNQYIPMWSMPNAKGHLSYHTVGYESWLRRKLDTKAGEQSIRQELRIVARLLQENKLPAEARKK